MTWTWRNSTAYDHEGMRHLIERSLQTAIQMNASDSYQDLPSPEVETVTIEYGRRLKAEFKGTTLRILVPSLADLWPATLAMHELSSDNPCAPEATCATLAILVLEAFADDMALRRWLNRSYPPQPTYVDKLKVWAKEVISPCCRVLIKEAQ